MKGMEFRLALRKDNLSHITRPGRATAFCGVKTNAPALPKGKPCERCFDFAATMIVQQEEEAA